MEEGKRLFCAAFVRVLLLLLCTSFFLSFSISKRVTIIFSLTCREEDDGTD